VQERYYAEVYVNINISDAKKVFHYSIPENMNNKIKCGHKVLVPFGNTVAEGFVAGFLEETDIENIKDIIKITNKDVIIPEHLMELGKWMSERYLCPLAKVLESFIPPGVKIKVNKVVTLNDEVRHSIDEDIETMKNAAPVQWGILNSLIKSENRSISYSSLRRKLHPSNIVTPLKRLEEKGYIITEETIGKGVKDKLVKHAVLYPDIDGDINELVKIHKITSKYQKKVLKCIMKYKVLTLSDLAKILDFTYSQVYSSAEALKRRGLVYVEDRKLQRDPYMKKRKISPLLSPTEEQKNVIKSIYKSFENLSNRKILLHGVTGSGKTEIYIRAAEKALEKGKSSIILVPEISLATQMIEIFKNRFGDLVAIYHSRLSKGERYDEWHRILKGEAKIIVGARSAIFAPVENLGLIVIDEEHETTYKQDEDPKYLTCEVAEKRADQENALLILGSATPSVETYYKCKKGIYDLAELKNRVFDRPLPEIKIVDMREEIKLNNRSMFSRKLLNNMKQALKARQQIILFLNRRGHSTFVLCRECGFVMKCHYCDISLTYHHEKKTLKCHYCGYERNIPNICPDCNSKAIRYFGVGTQRVEMEVKKHFPRCRTLRMDVDSTRKKGSHEKILDVFKKREADILIGTQMITKGLDFPGVSLVGIITADTCLNLPDFRAGERTFQLVTQVAGRSGRGDVPGVVIVQTYNPHHYSLRCAINHDYNSFYKKEISYRQELKYPPFSDMLMISINGQKESNVSSCALKLGDSIKKKYQRIWDIIGPSPAVLYRIKDMYRWQIAIKKETNKIGELDLMEIIDEHIKKYPNVNIEVDVNPFSLL